MIIFDDFRDSLQRLCWRSE